MLNPGGVAVLKEAFDSLASAPRVPMKLAATFASGKLTTSIGGTITIGLSEGTKFSPKDYAISGATPRELAIWSLAGTKGTNPLFAESAGETTYFPLLKYLDQDANKGIFQGLKIGPATSNQWEESPAGSGLFKLIPKGAAAVQFTAGRWLPSNPDLPTVNFTGLQ